MYVVDLSFLHLILEAAGTCDVQFPCACRKHQGGLNRAECRPLRSLQGTQKLARNTLTLVQVQQQIPSLQMQVGSLPILLRNPGPQNCSP